MIDGQALSPVTISALASSQSLEPPQFPWRFNKAGFLAAIQGDSQTGGGTK
jgi:hypothetical protein